MSFLVVVQTLIALIIIGIALWVVFHLLKALAPYKKTMAGLLILSIAGVVIYDQGYREYKANKSENDDSYSDESNSFYSLDDSYDDNCDNLPQFCYQMTNCSQAEEALECGNYELDGDSDGIPCESLCGNY